MCGFRTDSNDSMASYLPIVSVVLPTYNGAHYLPLALASCLGQTFRDLELIVVDDGSTDTTLEVLAACYDDRLRVVQHAVNQKLPTALNTGFNQARGDYYIWISDDDRFSPNALEILASFLDRKPEIDGVYADYSLMDTDGNPTQRLVLYPQPPKRPINTHAFLYRKQVFQSLGGYNPEYFLVEDYEFWLRAQKQFKLCYIPTPDPLYYLREHPGSLTDRNRWKVHEMMVKLRSDYLGIGWAEYNRQMAYVHVQAAFEAYRNQNYTQVRRRFLRVLARNPSWLLNRGFASITLRSYIPGFRHQGS